MIEENKYCSDVMEKYFKLVIIKKHNEDFKNSTKCWIYDNVYIEGDVKVRDYCHFRNHTGSTHRDCKI